MLGISSPWPQNYKEKKGFGEIYFVLNFQGCVWCATVVASKSLNNEKNEEKNTKKKVILYIYLKHLKNAIFLEPICFPQNGFYQGGQNRVSPDPA